jgi:hypothetical protein
MKSYSQSWTITISSWPSQASSKSCIILISGLVAAMTRNRRQWWEAIAVQPSYQTQKLLVSTSSICRLSDVIILSYWRFRRGLFCVCAVKWLRSANWGRCQAVHLICIRLRLERDILQKVVIDTEKMKNRLKRLMPNRRRCAGNSKLLNPSATSFPLLSLSVVILSTLLIVKSRILC